MLRLDPDPDCHAADGEARDDACGPDAAPCPPISRDDIDDVDEVSLGDVDLEQRPLPRVARTVIALWTMRLLVGSMMAAGVGLGAATAGVVGAVVVGLWLAVPVAIVAISALMVRRGDTDEGFLRIERRAHPGFFVVLDEVCADVGAPAQDSLYLVNDSNSYNGLVHGRSTILMGLGAIVAYDRTALRSTIGHELGHQIAGDAADPAMMSLRELEALSTIPLLLMPLAPLGRRLLAWAKPEALRRSRLHEHSADFWGGVAAGPGTTATCLMADRRAQFLWQGLVEDVGVLMEDGHRPRDLYGRLQRAVEQADADGFEMRPARGLTPTDSTHPGDRFRASHAEAQLQHLKARPVDTAPAIELFDNAAAIMADLTELYFDPDHDGGGDWLVTVDDEELWPRYIAALRPQVRQEFITDLDPEPLAPLTILLERVRPVVEAGGRLHDGDKDVTHRTIGVLLDLLVDEGLLQGSRHFGCQRFISLQGQEYFRIVLALKLAGGDSELWDDLEIMLRANQLRRERPISCGCGGRANNDNDNDNDNDTNDARAWDVRTDPEWSDITDDVDRLAAQ